MSPYKFAFFLVVSLVWAAILTLGLRFIQGHDWGVSMLSAGIIGAVSFGILIYSDLRWMKDEP